MKVLAAAVASLGVLADLEGKVVEWMEKVSDDDYRADRIAATDRT